MAITAIATPNTPWDCKWSRPGYRLAGVPDQFQPESVWVCVRTGERTPVQDTTCETCAFWQKHDMKAN